MKVVIESRQSDGSWTQVLGMSFPSTVDAHEFIARLSVRYPERTYQWRIIEPKNPSLADVLNAGK